MFEGQPCGWALRTGADSAVELVQSTKTPSRRVGTVPPPCEAGTCVYRGIDTPLGPVVVVEVAGVESEVPTGVWLGLVEGDQLRFVDLWEDAGDPVIDEGIALGPAHTLAPFDCEGSLALFAQPRIPGAEVMPAPSSLVAREGAVSGDAVQRVRCDALPVGLP